MVGAEGYDFTRFEAEMAVAADILTVDRATGAFVPWP